MGNKKENKMASYKDFLFAGISSISGISLLLPIDTIKVRMQILNEGKRKIKRDIVRKIIKEIYINNGIKGFYNGLNVLLLRQSTYGTIKYGLYKNMTLNIKKKYNQVLFYQKIYISLFSGFIASLIGNPSDLVLIRYQSNSISNNSINNNNIIQNNKNINVGKNNKIYRNIFHAFYSIVKNEGFFSLWKGSSATILRVMSLNLGVLTTYDEVFEYLNNRDNKKNNFINNNDKKIKNRLIASMISGD